MARSSMRPFDVNPAFWHQPDTVAALRRRDLGRLFRLMAIHTGASQTRIGTATALSQGQVSQIMNGSRQISSIDVLERVADGLGLPDDARMVLGLAPRGRDQPEAGDHTLEYPATASLAVARLQQITTADGDGRPDALNLAFRGMTFVIASRDWLLSRLTSPSAVPTRVTANDAAAVRDTFAALQELDTKYGGAQAHSLIVQYLRMQAIPLLGARGDAAALRATFYAVAELSYLAGLTAFDSGMCGLAEQYFTNALRLAQEAEDDAFAANVLAAMAHLASSHGRGREAEQLATAGLVAARRVGNSAVAMRLSIALARGHALQGNADACVRATVEAEQALDRAGTRDHRWTRFLDAAYLAGEMALCFLDLERPDLAERFAEQSVSQNAGRQRRLALSYAVLGAARGRLGNLDGATSALTEALDLTRQVQSSRALRAIGEAASAARAAGNAADPVLARAGAIVGVRAAGACCPRAPIPSTRHP